MCIKELIDILTISDYTTCTSPKSFIKRLTVTNNIYCHLIYIYTIYFNIYWTEAGMDAGVI